MKTIVIGIIVALVAGGAGIAYAQVRRPAPSVVVSEPQRFQMMAVGDGVWRLNTETGQMSYCMPAGPFGGGITGAVCLAEK